MKHLKTAAAAALLLIIFIFLPVPLRIDREPVISHDGVGRTEPARYSALSISLRSSSLRMTLIWSCIGMRPWQASYMLRPEVRTGI